MIVTYLESSPPDDHTEQRLPVIELGTSFAKIFWKSKLEPHFVDSLD